MGKDIMAAMLILILFIDINPILVHSFWIFGLLLLTTPFSVIAKD